LNPGDTLAHRQAGPSALPIVQQPGKPGIIATIAAISLITAACGGDGEPQPVSTQAPTVSRTAPPAGSPNVDADRVVELSRERAALTILGADSGDYLNDLPALATGDVNGDGLDDLLIGARFGDGPDNSRQDSGEAYIIFGRNPLPESIDLAANGADVTVFGANGKGASRQGDQLGFSGTLADVTGDGLDDIILGAPFLQREDSGAISGAAYVLPGGADLPGRIDLAEGSAGLPGGRYGLTLLGTHTSSYFGDSVAAGDVNGDGINDILVGAPFEARPPGFDRAGQGAGAVFAFFGGPDIGGTRDTAARQYDVAIYGEEEFEGGDETGDNVASGDLNDDGIDDIIITAEAADGPDNKRSVAAEVYVVYGSAGLSGALDIGKGDQDVTVYGADNNDTTGFNIGAADLTGDGVEDLLVSLRGGDGEGNRIGEAGELHIFAGGSLPEVIDLADYAADAYVYGADAADFLGNGIAAADFDGDGALELLAGLPGGDGASDESNSLSDAGEAFVVDARPIRGGVVVLAASPRLAVFGAASGDSLGTSVAAGDLDGDGVPEVILLSPGADRPDGGAPDAGAIYVIRR